jgi:hypothetical protein
MPEVGDDTGTSSVFFLLEASTSGVAVEERDRRVDEEDEER